MPWTALDRYAPRHGAAKLAAAFALGCGVALTVSGGGAAHPSPAATAKPATAHPSPAATAKPAFAHTPTGAAAAATAWCQTTTEVFIDGGWDAAVNALTINPFRALADRYQRAATLVHRRLIAARTPYAFRLWPLGYQVQRYSPTATRVRVWQLYVLSISAPEADTEFTTTIVTLQWTDGGWKVTAAPPGPDLPPPGDHASTGQVAAWVHAADRLDRYAYAP